MDGAAGRRGRDFHQEIYSGLGLAQRGCGRVRRDYPTVRLRLDRLIQKIELGEREEEEPYIALIKRLAVNDKLDFDTAKILINEYKKQKKEAE